MSLFTVRKRAFSEIIGHRVIVPLLALLILLIGTSRVNAQEPLCPSCGPLFTIYGSPSNVYQTPGATNQTATFVVDNQNTFGVSVTLSCSVQAPVQSCGSVTPSSVFVNAQSQQQVTVQYNVAGTTGTGYVFLTGYHDDEGSANPQQGFVQVNVQGPVAPGIVLRNRPDQLERGLCLTAGAGEAAWQCGDLLVAHGMPGYRTLGRDRALTLVYNSATAAPRPTVAVNVTQPWGAQTPDSVYAELRVGLPGGAQTVRASATYQGWAPGPVTKQIVLSYDASGHGTWVWDYTLLVRNKYASGPKDTTITGQLLLIDRSSSRFGRGWALAGVERILWVGTGTWPDGPMLWWSGDGTARLYQAVPGMPYKWVAPSAGFRDTLSYASPYYKRTLRHGVEVYFNGAGRHVKTVNRMGQETVFTWVDDSLMTVSLPPNGTGGIDSIFYSGANVDYLKDPGGRVLNLTVNAGLLTSVLDPDNVAVSFGYDAAGRMTSRTNRRGHATRYEYANGLRVTKAHVPYGPTGADTARTQYDPWDERGLYIGMGGSGLTAVDSFQIRTKIDGPRTEVADTAAFYVDRFGAPVRTVNALGAVTQIVRSDAAKPALVTKVIAANGRVDSLTWNARGNLTQSRTVTSDQPVQVTTWEYNSPNTADAPSRVTDPLNRSSYFYYNSQGLTDSTLDPRQLGTRYFYTTDWLVKAVRLHGVPVWRNADSTTDTLTLNDSLFYDAKGNLTGWRHANGTRTSYEVDTLLGRTVKSYDPLGMPTRYFYDAINRATAVWKGKLVESHPGGVNPLAGCDTQYFVCVDSTVALDPPSPNPGADSAYFKTRYAHSAATLDSVFEPRNVVRTYLYDARGDQRGERDEFSQLQTADRNAAGQVTSITSRDGFVTTFQYDALGRRTQMAVPARSNQHPGDPAGVPADTVVSQYDVMGNPTLTRNRDAVITRGFYQNGALKYRKTVVSGIVDSLHFWYDAAGALSRIRYNAKDSVRYTYATTGDLDSVIVTVKEGAAYTTRVFRFQWDKLGRRTQVTYPEYNMTVTLAYDQLGVLRRLNSTNSATSAATSNRFDFELRNRGVSPTGQILSQTILCRKWIVGDLFRLPCGSVVANQLTTNRFNHLGMLALQTVVGTEPRTDSTLYDASGNMTYRRRWDAGANKYERQFFTVSTGGAYGVSNRLSRDSSTTHDSTQHIDHLYTLAGDRRYERPTDSVDTYVHRFKWYYYDALGRMSGSRYVVLDGGAWFSHVGPDDCKYDGEGNMTKPCENGAPRLLYNGVNVSRSSNGWRFFHGPGLDDPLFAIMRNGSDVVQGGPFYFVTDGAGRQLAAGLADGTVPVTYQPGHELSQVGRLDWTYSGGISKAQSFSPDRFNGSTPATAGLSFFRNRAYDARTGRWTQEDPIGVAGGINLYQFNGNDPVQYADPFGLCPPEDMNDGPHCWMTRGITSVSSEAQVKAAEAARVKEGKPMSVSVGFSATGGQITQSHDLQTRDVTHSAVIGPPQYGGSLDINVELEKVKPGNLAGSLDFGMGKHGGFSVNVAGGQAGPQWLGASLHIGASTSSAIVQGSISAPATKPFKPASYECAKIGTGC